MRCELIKSDCMDDWYTIERVKHDGEHKIIDSGLYYSGRVSDACVEGTAAEMLAIAKAIETGDSVSFKRCAVTRVVQVDTSQCYEVYSPRNSRVPGKITIGEAQELASNIREVLDA